MAGSMLGWVCPGGGQFVRGDVLTGLLVMWTVPYLLVTALADLAATQTDAGLWAGAMAALRAGQAGPQPIWTVVLAIAVHCGAALAAARRA